MQWRNVVIIITCGDKTYFIRKLLTEGIEPVTIKHLDAFSFQAAVNGNELSKVRLIADKYGANFRFQKEVGAYKKLAAITQWPVTLATVVMLVIISLIISNRILFIQVEGNQIVPDKLIIEYANHYGLDFGAERHAIRSEDIKNSLLKSIGQLEWVGVNTSGCVASISVKERILADQSNNKVIFGELISSADGIIHSAIVTKGELMCKPGDAVKAGDLLVSSSRDLGLTVLIPNVEGEIFANTKREIQSVMMQGYEKKGSILSMDKKYALLFGKKRINLYIDSGIYMGSCDKMVEIKYLSLPGGFELPVGLLRETSIKRETVSTTAHSIKLNNQIVSATEEYINNQMVSGKILSESVSISQKNGLITLTGSYHCLEMIARFHCRETLIDYGEDN